MPRERPLNLPERELPSRIQNFGERLKLRKLRGGKWDFTFHGGAILSRPERPLVPYVNQRWSVPDGYRATAWLSDFKIEESAEPLDIIKAPKAHLWSDTQPPASLAENSVFPGAFLRSTQSGGMLHVSLFPVQVDMATNRTYVLRSGTVHVALEKESTLENWLGDLGRETLIVSTKALAVGARALQQFHESVLRTASEVVFLEDLPQVDESLVEADLPAGYKDDEATRDSIIAFNPENRTGYDYGSALRLIAYLRARKSPSSPTRYVVLLGDSHGIPPSYYFNTRSSFNRSIGVTDLCYAAVNRCTDPKLAVGRLPFSNSDEVLNYLKKVKDWLARHDSLERELVLMGGQAFPMDEFYTAELANLDLLRPDSADWWGVQKKFRTNALYNKANVLSVLNGEAAALFAYVLDHGTGNALKVEKELLTAQELLSSERLRAASPIVLSASCTNAAIDQGLMKDPIFGKPSYGDKSIGQALVESSWGPVAYVGAMREVVGSPIQTIDDSGNLEQKGTNYFLQLLGNVIEDYSVSGGGRLGDMVLNGLRKYIFESGEEVGDDQHRWTYLNLELLGDPALTLPRRNQKARRDIVGKSNSVIGNIGVFGIPEFIGTLSTSLSVSYSSPSDVAASLIVVPQNFFSDEVEQWVARVESTGDAEMAISPVEKSTTYLLKLENLSGVPLERQIWFRRTDLQSRAIRRP